MNEERRSSVEGARAFDRNNAISTFLMGALPAVAGSAISFLLGMFLVWGIISLALGRFRFRMTAQDRMLAWTFTIFALLVAATALIAEDPASALPDLVWLLPFLSLWVVIPRLRASPDLDHLHIYLLGAAAGCIGALVVAGVEIGLFGIDRPEGGTGNAAVFGVVCLCLTGLAGLLIDSGQHRERLLSGVAVLAGSAAVLISLTRGAIVVLPLVLLLVFAFAPARWRSIVMRPAALIPLLGAALVLYAGWDLFLDRVAHTEAELEQLIADGYSSSIGERLRLWGAAWAALLEAPVLGHGIQNRMDAVIVHLVGDGHRLRMFTHPHNGFLTAALDGGVVVLAALLVLLAMPVIVAWRAPRDGAWRRRLFMALLLVASYTMIGMTQIMFKHDILDSFYIYSVIVLAVAIPARREQADSAERKW